jgi:ATP-dependent Clp protease ATP-binding subunit ClpC
MYEQFTDQALHVMELANQESERFRHDYIGTEHILLGLTADEWCVAAQLLRNLDIDPAEVRVDTEQMMRRDHFRYPVSKPLTPRAKKVIDFAMEESRKLNHDHVGTEHLLLALLRDPETVAAQVLQGFDLDQEDLHRELQKLRSSQRFGQPWWE